MRTLWVHNFTPKRESSGVFMHILADRMQQVGVHVDMHYTGPLTNPFRLGRVSDSLSRIAKEYDLIHSQFGSACGFVVSRVPGAKLLSLRGTDMWGQQAGKLKSRLHGTIVRELTRRSLKEYRHVIVMSHRMRRDLARIHNYQKPVTILPCGIDLQRFQPMSRHQAREQLGFKGDERPWVLFSSVSQGNDVKRSWLAQAAVEEAQKARPDIVMKTLSGKPHETVPLWMNACNVVLLTSTHEGWPNIIKEALACNVPFASTDVSDLAAIADQEESCSVSGPNSFALSQGLLQAIAQSDRPDLRRHVLSMDADKAALSLRQTYEAVLGQAPASAVA